MQALLCSLEKASGSRRTRGESKVRIAGRQKPGWGLHRSGPALPSVFTFRKHCSALLWFHYEASVKIIRKKWKLQVKIYTHTQDRKRGDENCEERREGQSQGVVSLHLTMNFFKAIQVSKSSKAVQLPGNQEKGWFVTHHWLPRWPRKCVIPKLVEKKTKKAK